MAYELLNENQKGYVRIHELINELGKTLSNETILSILRVIVAEKEQEVN